MKSGSVLVLIPNSTFAANVPRDLVYGCWCAGKRIGGIKFPPLTSVLIATILRDNGIEADFRDLAEENRPMSVLDSVIGRYAAVVMLTSTMTINEDSEVLAHLKQINPELLTIVWGSHPTFLPLQTLSKPGIDIVVRREGDYIIRDLLINYLNNGPWQATPGISYRRGGEVTANPDYPFIDNLDELPFPDRSLLSPKAKYFNPIVKRLPYTTMYTTRGCPGKCTFCTAPPFYGGKVRMRSPDNILQELRLVRDLGYKEVIFRDEIFSASKKRLMAVANGIIDQGLDLSWVCSARVGTIDEEMIGLMKRSGCHMIRVGVESGVQEVLDQVKKGIRVEQTKKLLALAHKYQVGIHAHMMLGMPGDNEQTVQQTIEFIKKLAPEVVTFGICTPYPGTPLFEEVKRLHPDIEDGSACNLAKLHQEGFFNSSFCDLDEEALGYYVRKAYRSFYSRPSYLVGRLKASRNWEHLKSNLLAGLQVFSFSFNKGNG